MRIAFVGLGAMGLPMARNLAKTDGIDLVLFDVDQRRLAEAESFGQVAQSVAAAVADADYIFSVLPADVHVRTVGGQVREHGHAGQVYVDFSTISPATIRRVADELAPQGIETVGVALTRSTAAAQQGTLALFLGGPQEHLTRLRPAFDAMATDLLPTAGIEAAKAAKIVNNMVVAALDILACEAFVLGARLGFTSRQVLDAMAAHGADSWVLTNHIERYVLPDDLGPGRFSTRYMSKDVGLCGALARSARQPAFFTGLAESYYRGVRAHGHGDDYHMIVIRWLERGAAIGEPVTALASEGGEAGDLATLATAASAVTTLVTLEALTLAAHHGLPVKLAAEYMERGSGGSDTMRAVLSGDHSGLTWRFSDLAGQVDAATEHAARLDVPATIFEVARHVALSLAVRFGPDADVGTVLAELP
ncbi:NAD(P)-dependent oxidoreductase [Amycolatopsis pigmentata]|uniref:NAD(P)-dependent oxidoreductase n=1 Tax=Amycolatopsis pigmentata TaxID=450801 RepID=A0ABW5G0Z6_9PSEU